MSGWPPRTSGTRASAVLAEVLELAPFGKVLYSSDAFGLPELVPGGRAGVPARGVGGTRRLQRSGEAAEADVPGSPG